MIFNIAHIVFIKFLLIFIYHIILTHYVYEFKNINFLHMLYTFLEMWFDGFPRDMLVKKRNVLA